MKRNLLRFVLLSVMGLFTLGASAQDYLCLTANTADSKVTLTKKNTPDDVTLQYSTDGTNWYDYTIGTEVALVNANDKVYFRNAGTAETFSKDIGNYYYFVMDGSIAASGNVMSLIDNSCTATTIPSSYCFTFLFNNCTGLTSAPNLPAETLAQGCYWSMFSGCTGLTTAPELPATTLAVSCYQGMFYGCSSLTAAPALPVTSLAEGCYQGMFYGCTILTTAPELPANTLAAYCYYQMFDNCSGLTTAPTLPATTLAESCYYGMFQSCSGLTTAPALPATTLAKNCYYQMFYNCSGLTAAPALPVTTLAEKCYSSMFSKCTGLTTAPALPATTLAEGCYNNMFNGCTGLTTAPELPATTLAESCYSQMFNGCTGLTTAPELPATTLAASCYSQMFNGCTSLTTAPELPATTLAEKCYDQMFAFCTLLTTAPELPATNTAVGQCYNGMFNGCKKLESIKVGFNAWEKAKAQGSLSAAAVTKSWVSSVSSTGEFMCPDGLPETTGTSNIPSSWTVKNTYDLTVSGAWASMCVNLPLTVPEGAMVYYASDVEGSTITLTQIPANTVMAAKTAVIVKKPAEGTTVSFPIAIKDATITPCTDNLFQGSSVAKACNAGENYVLNASKSSDTNVHFSIYTGTTLTDHKAYLPKSAVGGATGSIQFRFGDATAISTVEMESSDDVLYNLAGQRVSEDYRGIVIKNGKKMFNL